MAHKPIPFAAKIYTCLAYALMLIQGYIRDYLFSYFFNPQQKKCKNYAPLCTDFGAFYAKHVYGRISDCWNRPVSSTPGAWVDVQNRKGVPFFGTLERTGEVTRSLNLGSYNYLGFAENSGKCVEDTQVCIEKYGVSSTSSRMASGTLSLHRELEQTVADFIGKEDAIVFGMGYATNSTTIPSLIGKGGLIISDSLNHASLVIGCRLSGAVIRVFKHNDPKDLERVLKTAVSNGQPRSRLPWKKILIIVEGLYSMEGNIVCLPEIVALKKKYKAYLYVDEAHSIGALGPHGRGVCEYWGVAPSDVDILMGTFTKSFASCGGYIAGNRAIIDYLRVTSFASMYDVSMSPVCAQQIISALDILRTNEGMKRIEHLRRNSIYFRTRLIEQGFEVYGDYDSPVIPIVMYSPAKIVAFSRMCLEKKLAVVIVGFPATDMLLGRARICMSASHTPEDMDYALEHFTLIGDHCLVKFYPPKQPLLQYEDSFIAKHKSKKKDTDHKKTKADRKLNSLFGNLFSRQL